MDDGCNRKDGQTGLILKLSAKLLLIHVHSFQTDDVVLTMMGNERRKGYAVKW